MKIYPLLETESLWLIQQSMIWNPGLALSVYRVWEFPVMGILLPGKSCFLGNCKILVTNIIFFLNEWLLLATVSKFFRNITQYWIPFLLDKHLKDLLSKLIDSGYFENIPDPCNKPEKEELKEEKLEKPRQLSKPESVSEIGNVYI